MARQAALRPKICPRGGEISILDIYFLDNGCFTRPVATVVTITIPNILAADFFAMEDFIAKVCTAIRADDLVAERATVPEDSPFSLSSSRPVARPFVANNMSVLAQCSGFPCFSENGYYRLTP